jgi:hypothetical protein
MFLTASGAVEPQATHPVLLGIPKETSPAAALLDPFEMIARRDHARLFRVSVDNTASVTIEIRRPRTVHTDAGPADSQYEQVARVGATVQSFRARDAIFELRRLTGFTWQELADLLSVTRRSLHLWASGGRINGPNERHIRDLLGAMRTLDRGTATENRGLLLAPQPDGGIFGDLLRYGRFEEAVARAGCGRARLPPVEVRADPRGAASKLSVANMLGTLADRIRPDDGGSLPPRGGRHRV